MTNAMTVFGKAKFGKVIKAIKVASRMEYLCASLIDDGVCGYVYIFNDKERNKRKIGFTTNIKARIRTIVTSVGCNDYDYYVTELILNPQGLEKKLHTLYAAHRLSGEWFDIDGDEVVNSVINIMSNIPYATTDELVELVGIRAEKSAARLHWMTEMVLGKPIHRDGDGVTDVILPSIRKTGAYSTQMMSPIEILEMQVTLLKQHEAQLKEIRAKQIEQDSILAEQKEQLHRIEAKVTTTNSEYFSISGYASLKGVRTLDACEVAKIDKYCAKLSEEQGYLYFKSER